MCSYGPRCLCGRFYMVYQYEFDALLWGSDNGNFQKHPLCWLSWWKTTQMRNDMSDSGRNDHFHLIQSYSDNVIYYSQITFLDTDDWLRMGAIKPIKSQGWITNTWSGEVKHNEVSWISWLRLQFLWIIIAPHYARWVAKKRPCSTLVRARSRPQFQSRNLSVVPFIPLLMELSTRYISLTNTQYLLSYCSKKVRPTWPWK